MATSSDRTSHPTSVPTPTAFAPGTGGGSAPSGPRSVRAAGADLFFDEAGAGHPLVILHAGVADRRMWDAQMAAFAAHHRVIRYDLRGFGESTLPDEPYASHNDLRDLLDALQIPQAHVLGVSMGGTVALDFAIAYPDRVSALIVCGASPSGTAAAADIRAGWDAVNALLEAGDITAAIELELRMWVDGPFRGPDQVDPTMRERVREMEELAFARALAQPEPETLELQPPAAERLGEIVAPTLVLVGDLDFPQKVDIAGAVAAGIPDARLEIITGTAHLPNMEAPQRFNRLVMDFRNEIDAQVP